MYLLNMGIYRMYIAVFIRMRYVMIPIMRE